MADLDHRLMTPPFLHAMHKTLTPSGDAAVVWQLRVSQPNVAHVPMPVLHSVEHFLIDLLREASPAILGAAPMGCQTGYYIFDVGVGNHDAMAQLVADALHAITKASAVPHANLSACGWAENHSLPGASELASWLLRQRDTWSELGPSHTG